MQSLTLQITNSRHCKDNCLWRLRKRTALICGDAPKRRVAKETAPARPSVAACARSRRLVSHKRA